MIIANVTCKGENKIAGNPPDSQGIHATLYVNNGDKERCKVAGIRSKYDQIMIVCIYI